ncbi:MAG: ATP-grasp domain-containing protein [Burkholderiaceae bacterium]|nr:ATP-grasp domain-containing protein [Burkholderiaceae bacterium]
MKVRQIRTLDGPNVFHHQPVLSMLLELGELRERTSATLPGFIDRLLEVLPGLRTHRCSVDRPGGFVLRLHDGTFLGHVVEHVALELSRPTGIDVSYGKTVATAEPGVFQVVVHYRCEPAMRHLLYSAVALVDGLVEHQPVNVTSIIAEAQRLVARHALGPSTQSIVNAATAQSIPWRRIGATGSLIRLGWGSKIRWIKTAVSDKTSLIAAENAQDKALTKQLLTEAQIRVPQGGTARTADEAVDVMRTLKKPVVIKPQGGNHGRGITLRVTTPEAARAAFEHAAKVSRVVLIEEQMEGDDYRIAVVNGKVVAVAHRVPAHVIGDGVSSIERLIENENRNPLRGIGHAKPLTRIIIDDAVRAVIDA